jgi:hypothetical protein
MLDATRLYLLIVVPRCCLITLPEKRFERETFPRF